MADTSAIEWTDATWNPVVGCTHVSAGCDCCYAAREASGRLRQHPVYAGLAVAGRFTGEVRLLPNRMQQPLRWRKPRRVFVNSMSDLFHPKVPVEFVAAVFEVMAATPRHTYQVLTKRPGRMRSILTAPEFVEMVQRVDRVLDDDPDDQHVQDGPWPLRNVWLGTSVEDQRWADVRVPLLLKTPAAVRFISCEPLLGPVDLREYLNEERRALHWVIAGGESGPDARPMHPDWARSLRDQCQAAHVAFFFKQVGGLTPKAGGRELDGRTWDEFPEVRRG